MSEIDRRRRRAISIMNSRATPEDIRNHAENVGVLRNNGFLCKIANSLRNIIQRRDFTARKRQRFYDLCDQYAEQKRKVVSADLNVLQSHRGTLLFATEEGTLLSIPGSVQSTPRRDET